MINAKLLKPKVEKMLGVFLNKCSKAGIQLIVTQGYRSIKEQNDLYAIGRTKPGKIVTNAKGGQSMHNFGVAFDVCFLVNKQASYNGNWQSIAKIAKSIGLEWGGDWKGFVDKPHFQYTAGYSLADFQKNRIDPKKFL